MAIYVDFVGLNTLVQEPVDTATNSIGSSVSSSQEHVRNTSIKTINQADYLVALNTHRNGPYGYSMFRQVRNANNPLVRKQKLDNTFSHFEYPGSQLVVYRGSERLVLPQKRGKVKNYLEVPVVSKHKPLKLEGSVVTVDPKTSNDTKQEVEVYTTLGNATQHFSNQEVNNFFNLEEILDDDYENFIDLYLAGGLDGDESPIDEFKSVTYSQVVYPREKYTYTNNTRNRPNFVSGYWRDKRSERTELNLDNGFGFTVFSQSMWVLDGEQDFKDLTFVISSGSFYMQAPHNWISGAASSSAFGFNFPSSSGTSATDSAVYYSSDLRLIDHTTGSGTFFGYNTTALISEADNKYKIEIDAQNIADAAVSERIADRLEQYFESQNFNVSVTRTKKAVYSWQNQHEGTSNPTYLPHIGLNTDSKKQTWVQNTTQSCLSWWMRSPGVNPASYGPDGVFFEETVDPNGNHSLADISGSLRRISFDTSDAGATTLNVDVATYMARATASSPQSPTELPGGEYTGYIRTSTAHEVGAGTHGYDVSFVRFSWENVFGSNNRFSPSVEEAHGKWNHFFIEMDMASTGSNPATTGSTFRTNLANIDGNGGSPFPIRFYINGESAGDPTVSDPHDFLTGSANYRACQNQIGDSDSECNVSIKKTSSPDPGGISGSFSPITPFDSTGFSFSYWFSGSIFIGADRRDIFSIKDTNGTDYIRHYMLGRNPFTSGEITLVTEYTSSVGSWASTTDTAFIDKWHNVTMTVMTSSGGTDMDHLYHIDATSSATSWHGGSTMTITEWSGLSSSVDLVVASGSEHPWNLDQLAFWNGGLNETQLSGAYNSGSYMNFDTGSYPKTSPSKQLQIVNSTNAIMRNSFKSYEMNAYRGNLGTDRRNYQPFHAIPSSSKGLRIDKGPNQAGHIIIPGKGGWYSDPNHDGVDFDQHVLAQGSSGSFDMSLWFKCTEGNVAHRSLRFSGSLTSSVNNYEHGVTCWASSSFPYIDSSGRQGKPTSFSFWMKIPNMDKIAATNYSHPIFAFSPREPHDYSGADNAYDMIRKNHFALYIHSGSGGVELIPRISWRNHPGEVAYTSFYNRFDEIDCGTHIVENKWTHVHLLWNGKYGPRARIFYNFNGEHISSSAGTSGSVNLNVNTLTYTGSYEEYVGTSYTPSTSSYLYLAGFQSNRNAQNAHTEISLCEFSVIGDQYPGPATRLISNDWDYTNHGYKPSGRQNMTTLNYKKRGPSGITGSEFPGSAAVKRMSGTVVGATGHTLSLTTPNGDYGGYRVALMNEDEGIQIRDEVGGEKFDVRQFGSGESSFIVHWVAAYNGSPTQINNILGSNSIALASIDIGSDAYASLYIDTNGKIACAFKESPSSGPEGSVVCYLSDEAMTPTPKATTSDWQHIFSEDLTKFVWSWAGTVNGSGEPVKVRLHIKKATGQEVVFRAEGVSGDYVQDSVAAFPSTFTAADLNSTDSGRISIGPTSRVITVDLNNANNNPDEYPDHWILCDVGCWDNGHYLSVSAGIVDTAIGRNYPLFDHYCPSNIHSASVSEHMWFWGNCSPDVSGDTNSYFLNALAHDPDLKHYYKLGIEEEFWGVPYDLVNPRHHVAAGDTTPRYSINNSGSLSYATLKWGENAYGREELKRQVYMDDVPKEFIQHNELDSEHHIFQLVNAKYPYSSEPRQDGADRGDPGLYRGIELTLTGGYPGYALVSSIEQSTTNQLLKSADNSIVPGKWYHLYASYSDFNRTSGAPSVDIYIDGIQLDMSSSQIHAGSGHWDPTTAYTDYGLNGQKILLGTHGKPNSHKPTGSVFSGIIQDFTLWDNNDSDRKNMFKRALWGAYDNSHYVDTSDPNLIMHIKIGKDGAETSNAVASGYSTDYITAYTGSAFDYTHWNTTEGNVAKTYSGTKRNIKRLLTTDVPKNLSAATGSTATTGQFAIAFWGDFTNHTGGEFEVLSFSGDDYESIWPDYYYSNYANQDQPIETDTSVDADNNTSKTKTFTLRMWKYGNYIQSRCRIWFDVNHNDGRVRDEPYYSTSAQVPSMNKAESHLSTGTMYTGNTPTPGTGRHHWLYVFSNSSVGEVVYIYLNGDLVKTQTFDFPFTKYDIPFPTFNNISIGQEDNEGTNIYLDEIAILKVDSDQEDWTDSSVRDAMATRLYSSGNNYNYSLEGDERLVSWWRMGENNNTSISVDTNLQSDAELSDQAKQTYHMRPLYNNKFMVRSLVGAGSDLVAHYDFNENQSPATTVDNGQVFADRIGSHHLTCQAGDGVFEWDFTFDSYYIQTEAWLINRVSPDVVGFSASPAVNGGQYYNGINKSHTPGSRAQAIADIAIYRGIQTSDDKNKAKTTLTFASKGELGDQLRFIQGEDATTIWVVNFSAASSETTFGSGTTVHGVLTKTANIDSDDNLETQMDNLDTLLSQTGTGEFSDGVTYTLTNTTSSVTIEANTAANRTHNVHAVATVWTNAEPTIEVIKGYEDFVKSLTGYPKHHYVRMNDTAYHNNLPSTGTPGLSSSGAPFVYYYQDTDGPTNFNYSSNTYDNSGGGGPDFNLSLGNATTFSPGIALTSAWQLESGSYWAFTLTNQASLDLNWINIARNNWWDSGSVRNFVSPSGGTPLIGGSTGARSKLGPGILQNNYNQFTTNLVTGSGQQVDTHLSAACAYFRRHSLTASTSLVSPYSGFMTKLSSSHNSSYNHLQLTSSLSASHLYLGSAKWETGRFAGYYEDGVFIPRPVTPFFDKYTDFIADARPLMKDYGIVPEFKISDHVEKYLRIGPNEPNENFLEITGGLPTAASSNKDDFYEIYSTTDFLKHFELIQEDHSDFVDPHTIKLKCSVVKKFLPYEGFYPAQRTVQIAQQFYNSNAQNLNVTGNFSSTGNRFAGQYLLNPLFSPGVLFNSVKAGVACDYPLITDTGSIEKITGSQDGGAMITQPFDTRIPFEALLEPEKYLSNIRLASNEPDPNGDTGVQVVWSGQSSKLYNLMVSNFLSEVPEFFLMENDFTTITSLSQGDPNFGNAQAGKHYHMRLRMFRNITGSKTPATNVNNKSFGVPQDNGSMSEAFTMYSRPSAFGPPHFLSASFVPTTWAEYKNGAVGDMSYSTGSSLSNVTGADPRQGYNYTFTPPYYHGEAWADIIFKAETTKKYTLSEIINESSVEFYRFYESGSGGILPGVTDQTMAINDQAMQLASSVNLFSMGVLEGDIFKQGSSLVPSITVNTDLGDLKRWIIQSKFETPILNFNHYTYGTSSGNPLVTNDYGITLPGTGPGQTPIGMWHQYGRMPQKDTEGVFLQVTPIPKEWFRNKQLVSKDDYTKYAPLTDLCGFSTTPVRMGEVSGLKEISEAVVAIPFYEVDGRRKFFNLSRESIDNALDDSRKQLVGESIIDMVEKMQKFVIPPAFDFLYNSLIDPFSMYIFEFTHKLDKQDLADIWQNLPPKITTVMETGEASITHELLSYELLGQGAKYRKGAEADKELMRNERSTSLNPDIQWMVFKIKQKATTNYFEKIYARNESQQALSDKIKRSLGETTKKQREYSYNWPYDYCSLIEGIKLSTEVQFLELDDDKDKVTVRPKVKIPMAHRPSISTIKPNIVSAIAGPPPSPQPQTQPLPTPVKRGAINRPRRTTTSRTQDKKIVGDLNASKNKGKK